jgi:hypothetical protein
LFFDLNLAVNPSCTDENFQQSLDAVVWGIRWFGHYRVSPRMASEGVEAIISAFVVVD